METSSHVDFSVVSPVYGCRACLHELLQRLHEHLGTYTYEVILVDDQSPDGAWEEIIACRQNFHRVRGIRLSKNFGQHAAIQAGLELAKGEAVIVMDCDLQDRPDQLPKLIEAFKQGYDAVLARRTYRADNWFKTFFSKTFYRLLSYLTETDIDPSIANYGIYSKKVVKAVLDMGDYVRFFPSMVSWVGFKTKAVDVEHGARTAGKSSYSFGKLLRLGVNVIISFSDKPLRLLIKFGFFLVFLVLIAALIVLYKYLTGSIEVLGYTSLILSVWFIGGLTMSLLGLIGIYLGKAFDQVKERPVYIIAESTDDHKA